eukprot:EST44203.1 Hypothetical protein SS50377_16010 [Spironucleus salmonicida]
MFTTPSVLDLNTGSKLGSGTKILKQPALHNYKLPQVRPTPNISYATQQLQILPVVQHQFIYRPNFQPTRQQQIEYAVQLLKNRNKRLGLNVPVDDSLTSDQALLSLQQFRKQFIIRAISILDLITLKDVVILTKVLSKPPFIGKKTRFITKEQFTQILYLQFPTLAVIRNMVNLCGDKTFLYQNEADKLQQILLNRPKYRQ